MWETLPGNFGNISEHYRKRPAGCNYEMTVHAVDRIWSIFNNLVLRDRSKIVIYLRSIDIILRWIARDHFRSSRPLEWAAQSTKVMWMLDLNYGCPSTLIVSQDWHGNREQGALTFLFTFVLVHSSRKRRKSANLQRVSMGLLRRKCRLWTGGHWGQIYGGRLGGLEVCDYSIYTRSDMNKKDVSVQCINNSRNGDPQIVEVYENLIIWRERIEVGNPLVTIWR